MNFSKSKVLLKKINAIHDSAESFDGKFSALEKDLMLQYLRDLYECVYDFAEEKADEVGHRHPTAIAAVSQSPGTPVGTAPLSQAPVDNQAPPIAKNHHNSSSNGTTKSVAHQEITETPQVLTSSVVDIDPELDALFDEKSVTDLSQRFANSPISDVSKAMGINERILTINELFKGDQQAFQDITQKLNGLSSFADAKQFLIDGVASDNNWASAKKVSKAAVFIKLIRRRYP